MSIQQENLSAYRGDDWGMKLVFSNPDGTPLPITGWIVFFTLKRRKTDSDVDAAIQKNVTAFPNAIGGEAVVTLTKEETANLTGLYYYDFKYKDQKDIVQTILSGGFTFEVNITRRNSS